MSSSSATSSGVWLRIERRLRPRRSAAVAGMRRAMLLCAGAAVPPTHGSTAMSGRDLLPRAIQRSRVLIVPAYEGCDVAVVDRPEEILRRSVGEAEDAACGLPVEAVRSRRQRGLGATVRAAVRRRAE